MDTFTALLLLSGACPFLALKGHLQEAGKGLFDPPGDFVFDVHLLVQVQFMLQHNQVSLSHFYSSNLTGQEAALSPHTEGQLIRDQGLNI